MGMTESELFFRLTLLFFVVVILFIIRIFHICNFLFYNASNVKYRLHFFLEYKRYPTFGEIYLINN